MKRCLSGFFLFFLGVGCQTTADPNLQTHMLRLECTGPDGTEGMSRLAVLDVGDPKYDFGFVAGHAVPSERPCFVKDFVGGKSKVSLIHLAENYQAGEQSDWAVIRFKKIKTKGLVRYTLEPVEEIGSLLDKEFSFARARGLSENSQKCKLSILNFSAGRRHVAHDCRAVEGQSGSPITRKLDGKFKLVGIHIGNLWMFKSPETGRPDKKGYINLLDQKTVAEIDTVITSNRN